MSYIGKKFGDRDHTTVLYACEKIKKWLKTDKQLEETIRKIRARFEY
ncbi:MAG: helix-turn-helix domain-containing protein [Patescibacteria group bacterium]